MTVTFASWVRTGIVGGGATILAPTAGGDRLATRLRTSVNGIPSAAVDVTVLGPGDVVGIDPIQIIRTDPHNGAEGFETTRFAAIEFSRADLPWLFTPAAGGTQLRPWICLVVVPTAACSLEPRANCPPVLTVDADELPPIADSWAWAHVQTTATGPSAPAGSRSRLVAPRQLRPFTQYLAAVVPTYEAGRLAGQLLAPGQTNADAWVPGGGDVILPAYHHWIFSTGEDGDFESMARGLTALPQPPAGLGIARLDVGAPGPAALAAPGRITTLLGALAAAGSTLDAWGPADRAALLGQLSGDPLVLAPPIYGAVAAGVTGAPTTGTRRWLGQLNLHPALRAAAGMGSAAVRRRQHDFVQEAWEQAGEVEAANRLLNRGRLGRRVSVTIERRHVAPRDDVDLLSLAGPVLRRMPDATLSVTVAGRVKRSKLPMAALGPQFRRLIRPTGPVARRGVTAATTTSLVTGLAGGIIDHTKPGNAGGLPTLGGVLDVLDASRAAVHTPGGVGRPPRTPSDRRPDGTVGVRVDESTRGPRISITDRDGLIGGTTTVPLDSIRDVPTKRTLDQFDLARLDAGHVGALGGQVTVSVDGNDIDVTEAFRSELIDLVGAPAGEVTGPHLDLATLATDVRVAMAPYRAVTNATLSLVERPDAVGTDALEPVMLAPRIDEPLWDDLAEMANGLLLPGAEALPREHATVVTTSPKLVAAFLAGANEEMMRELRWRGYPTDGRGTVFRRFWNRHHAKGTAAPDLLADIDAWRDDLGAQVEGAGGELVLVIRSELFRRYPGTVVTAVKAIAGTPRRPDNASAEPPAFHGTMRTGSAFFGFTLTLEEAVGVPGDAGRPGWFIVFHQPPTDLGFGLDAPQPEAVGEPPTWLDPTSFGADAAAVATSLAQLPVRLAIHASDLVRVS